MKKILSVLLLLTVITGCSNNNSNSNTNETVTHTPSVDMANGETLYNDDDSSGITLSVYSPDLTEYYFIDHNSDLFKGITFLESLKIYNSDFTGIIYYGYPTCPFCNEALPVLLDVAESMNQQVFYVNVHQEGEEINQEMIDEYKTYTVDYWNSDENGEKAFYVPTVYAIKDGQVVDYHVAILEDETIDTSSPLTDSQYNSLSAIYTKMFDKIR